MIDQCFFEREFGKGLGIGDSNLGIGNRIVSSHRLIYILGWSKKIKFGNMMVSPPKVVTCIKKISPHKY